MVVVEEVRVICIRVGLLKAYLRKNGRCGWTGPLGGRGIERE